MIHLEINTSPVKKYPFLVPVKDSRLSLEAIDIFSGYIEFSKPVSIEAIVLAADLQGIVLIEKPSGDLITEVFPSIQAEEVVEMEKADLIDVIPVGVVLPDFLQPVLKEMGISPERVLVLLGGDLYGTYKRGGSGDVFDVWQAFEKGFGRVIGVLGNHDFLPPSSSFSVLDGNVVSYGGITIGGVSGVIGNPKKPNRKAEEDYHSFLTGVMKKGVDILIIHESPEIAKFSLPGRSEIALWLKESSTETLVCSGHIPWETVVCDLPPHRVINAEQRVIILQTKKASV